MTNQAILAPFTLVACFSMAILLFASTASGGDAGNLPSSSSSSQADSSKSNSAIKTLLSDSGELSVMTKRRSGFLPSRGKKDGQAENNNMLPSFSAAAAADDDDAAAALNAAALEDAAAVRLAFLNDVAKRASGFLPMRGRKAAASSGSDYEEVMEKRRVASFMPMRGRKWDTGSGQAELAVPAAASGVSHYQWLPPTGTYFHATAQQHPMPMFYYPVKSDSASYYDDQQQQPAMEAIEKRKGMGFFGARGKRSVSGTL